MSSEEESLGDEIAACRVGYSQVADVFLGEELEESLSDVLVLPQAVECMWCSSHSFRMS